VCSALFAAAADAQTIATVHPTPGWRRFGEALLQGAAASGVRGDTSSTQTDIRAGGLRDRSI